MRPSFNTAGPCIPGEHYMLPPERRLDRVRELVEDHRYFTLHAGRQTGKTTSMMWLADHLEASGRFRALWVDLRTAREKPDVARAMTALLATFDRALAWRHPELPRPGQAEIGSMLSTPKNAILTYLTTLVRDRGIEVTAAHVDAAKETIILERRTHIDSLVARLREDRVRRVLAPMLAGGSAGGDTLDDDLAYVVSLGLARERAGRYEIANPIYAEVLPRALTHARQVQIANEPAWYVRPDGSLDMGKLMADWQVFWRKDGHLAAEGFHYREAGPHLMLMAFLQRVVNGGGRIEREYGLGRWVEWRGQRHAIEVKLRRDTETEAEALDQVTGYLERLGLREGWLVMFDLRSSKGWDERLTMQEVEHRGRRVVVVGC